MKILIIGGVAAGTKAAAKLKRLNRNDEVTIITKSKEISYAGCGLPYFVGGVIQSKEQLIVNTPQKFQNLTGVSVITETEAVKINRTEKSVEAVNLNTNETSVYTYDKLIIATGASPIKPPIQGTGLQGVFFLRTPEDAVSLRAYTETGEVRRAIVAGGGFIGLETAENLSKLGIRVTVLDMAPHILPGFDAEIADYVENHLSEHNIMTFTDTALEEIIGDGKVEKVRTSRRTMKADAVILSVGIRANTSFLDGTGIGLMPNRTIKVDEYLQTNDEDIYAIGDCACVTNRITNAPAWSPMGSSANMEGRLAAKNLHQVPKKYPGVLGTAVVKLPGLNAGRTGLTETAAKEAGYDTESVIVAVDDKAHYYPEASTFIIKMIADRKTKKLLGIQVLGKGAVDKVADIAATAISLHASLEDLENMDLAYAPPFSTAIHPFTHTINILLNKMDGTLDTIKPSEFQHGAADGYKLIDVSMQPSILNASFVDLVKVNGELPEFKKDDKLLLVCTKGRRAYLLQNRLKFYGYTNTKVLEGGTTFNQIDQ